VIILLYGGNELAMRRRLQQLKDETDGGSGMLMTNVSVVDGRDAKPGDVLGPCMAPPFLTPRRLVIVEHLLERLEPRFSSRPGRGLGAWEELPGELAKGIPETTTLVFFGQPFLAEGRARTVTSSNPLVAALKKTAGAVDEEFPELKPAELLRYINEEAALRGLRFKRGGQFEKHEERPQEQDPVQLLANLLQGDTLSIANELDKLALYARDSGGEVSLADVNRVCHGDRDVKSWDFTDAVLAGNLGSAMNALAILSEAGEEPLGLLGLLTARFRSLGPVSSVVGEGQTAREAIAAELKRPNNYPLQKDIESSRRWRPAAIRHAYELLTEAERSFKTGEVDDDLALEIAVMKLCALAQSLGPAPAGRR
jgi:DNA polymerase III delta subunit